MSAFKSGFCKICNQTRLVKRKTPNHLIHFLLSLLTMGFWIIIWIGLSVQIGGWRCSYCGSKKIKGVS